MARDVASLVRYTRGTLMLGGVAGDVQVDAVVGIDEFAVVAHPRFATLVVAGEDDALEALADADGRAERLRDAVLVTHAATPRLRAALADATCTAIIGTAQSEAVLLPSLTALLAVDQAAEDRAVTAAMKVLTLAARRGGVRGVVAELAHRIDGWVALVDRNGQVITTAGAGGLHVEDAVAVATGRPVRVRHRALQVHPVGSGEDLSARLVVAPRSVGSSRARELGSQTAALLDLVLRTHDTSRTERLGRAVLVDALLEGGERVPQLLRDWGVHERTLTAFALSARSVSVDTERLLVHWLTELGAAHVFAEQRGVLIGFLRDDHAAEIAERVEAYSSVLFLGLGAPAPTAGLARGATEAQQALDVARADVRRVVRYDRLPTISYVFERLDARDTRAMAGLLDALREDGVHGELTDTLRAFLAENGAWGVTATRLGIHRQTLAHRIRRVESLTGLALSDADDRTAAWLALRALMR